MQEQSKRRASRPPTPMAEPNPPLCTSKLPTPKFRAPNPQPRQAPAKFLSGFFYKVIFFTIFIALLPLLPSQAPGSVNKSIFTRSWELLHLLIVGIAISYGLFSRRNTEPRHMVGPALFLASDDAEMVNGQILVVDGGNIMPV